MTDEHQMQASALAHAARNLLENSNPDNDNFGTYAALQEALEAYDESQ